MSDAHATDTAHAAPAHAPEEALADAGHDAGHHDEHGHDGIQLGGIDWAMWATGALGILAGLVVVAAFVMATAGIE